MADDVDAVSPTGSDDVREKSPQGSLTLLGASVLLDVDFETVHRWVTAGDLASHTDASGKVVVSAAAVHDLVARRASAGDNDAGT